MLWVVMLLLPLAEGTSELAAVLQLEVVEYSSPVINTTYIATDEFDTRAMGPLYNATPYILDAIVNKQAYPEGIVTVEGGELYVAPLKQHWRELAAHYAGPEAVLAVALTVAAILPLVGLVWCCCYWCRAGRRRRPFDRKYDTCLKAALALLLIALLTLFLFGIVCAFASDAQTEAGLADAPRALRAGLADARQYLNATQAHARHLLVDNYRQLEARLNAILASSSITVSAALMRSTRAGSAAERLVDILGSVNSTLAGLRDVQRLSGSLQTQAETLNAELRKVKGELLQTLAQCSQPQCVRLQEKYKIGELDTEIQYSQLPDVSDVIARVEALQAGAGADPVRGAGGLIHMRAAVARAVSALLPPLQHPLRDTGARLERLAAQMTERADNASAWLLQRAELADTLAHAHHALGPARRHAARAAPLLATAVCVLLACGLACGVCGKRPDVYGASDCCNKGAGASCLLCGIELIFLCGSGVLLMLAFYFLVGATAQRFICDPLMYPEGNRLFSDLELMVDLEHTMYGDESYDEPFNMRIVLEMCHQNNTIYEVLQLRRVVDLEELQRQVLASLGGAVEAMRPRLALGPVRVLPPVATRALQALAGAALSGFNLARIQDALDTNITSLPLLELAGQLARASEVLEERAGFQPTARALARCAHTLRRVHSDTLTPLAASAAELQNVTLMLQQRLHVNGSSQEELILSLLRDTEAAELSFSDQASAVMLEMAHDYGNVVITLVREYLQRVLVAARQHVGRCGPLSRAYNATTARACKHVLTPVHGYWVSLAWCVALLLPLLLVSQKLARLYLQVDPYPGPLVEAEYLYDAYADRDNVPLANAYKAEKRAGAARASRAPDAPRRYNDMAPKHWEEGPPRYHGPTEYERPPPYYYPGSADRQ